MGTKKQKAFIIVIILLVLLFLFVPIPYYSSGDAHCIIGPCTKKGWYLNGSLWDVIVWRIKNPNPTMKKSISLPSSEKSKYPKYGHAPDYSWVAGRIEVFKLEGGCITVVFSEQGIKENYFGRLTIQPQTFAKQKNLKNGDLVVLKGRLVEKPTFSMACPQYNYETKEILFH